MLNSMCIAIQNSLNNKSVNSNSRLKKGLRGLFDLLLGYIDIL